MTPEEWSWWPLRPGNVGGKDGNCIADPRRLCVPMIRRMELVAPETGNAGGKDGNCIVDPRGLCVRMIRTVTPGERLAPSLPRSLAPSLASSNLLIGLPHP